jgi:hypothetical protein
MKAFLPPPRHRLRRWAVARPVVSAAFWALTLGGLGLVGLFDAREGWGELALGVGLLALGVYVLRARWRALTTLRAVAADGEEVVLRVTGREPRRGAMRYHWALDGQPRIRGELVAPSGRRPLFLDEARTRILGLRSKRRPRAIVGLHDDLSPLRCARNQVDAIRDAIDLAMRAPLDKDDGNP